MVIESSVSVVIPAHNAQNTIGRAISAVLSQTTPPCEIIVVDDASEDGTGACVESFRKKGANVAASLVRHPVKRGPAAARNTGWDLASGEYVAFLDADDSWHPQKLEIQRRWMAEHPQCVASAHRIVYLRRQKQMRSLVTHCPCVAIPPWKLKLFSCLLWPSSLMFRRELKHRFDPTRFYAEDRLLLLEMVLSGLQVVRLELPLGYRYNAPYGESGLSRDLWKAERAELHVFRQLREKGTLGPLEGTWLQAFSLGKYICRVCRCRWRLRRRGMREVEMCGAHGMDPLDVSR
jgi:cellulose synthase/poly-beta-1,6-N-acetylglucosamine synthase-like glycosyltransferase